MSRPNEEIVLPENLEAERFALGAALTDREAFPQMASVITADDFALEKHKTIFRRMADLHERGDQIERISLAEELGRHGQLPSVDGLSYIVSLDDGLPILHNLEGYCALIRRKSVQRRAIRLAHSLIDNLQSGNDSEELLTAAEKIAGVLTDSAMRKLNARTVSEIIEAEGGLNEFLHPDSRPGIHIPFETIQQTLSGLRRGKMIVLGARPAVGKTALATQMAEHAALNGNNVVFVSVEMKARELLQRSITGRAQVSAYRFRTGRLGESERHDVVRETNALVLLGSQLLLVEEADVTVPAIDGLLRSLRAQGQPASLCIVDYIQLLSSVGRQENRVQEVSAISRGLKKIAQRFDIPVLALSQLRRQERGASAAEPDLADLKESGQLEQDADQVIFLWANKEPEEGQITREIRWRVAKNRDGMVNRGTLNFSTRWCRFEEVLEATEAA